MRLDAKTQACPPTICFFLRITTYCDARSKLVFARSSN